MTSFMNIPYIETKEDSDFYNRGENCHFLKFDEIIQLESIKKI